MKIKNQKGAISVFVLLAMLFFLVFIMSAYAITARKVQTQTMTLSQLQYYYKRDPATIASTKYSSTSIIPIYNYEQLKLAGTNTYAVVDNKVHFFKDTGEYQLKANIVIDFDNYFSQSIDNIEMLDWKVDAPSGETPYKVASNGFNIYYYKDGAYWKLISYQNVNSTGYSFTSSTPTTAVRQKNRYSIMNTITGYKYDENKDGTQDYYEFMLIYNNGTSNSSTFSPGSYMRWRQNQSPNETRTSNTPPGFANITNCLSSFGGLLKSSNTNILYSGNNTNEYQIGILSGGTSLKSNGNNYHSKYYLFARVDPR